MKFVCWPFFILALTLTACAPAKRGEEASVTTTYAPMKPTVSQEGSYSVVNGATIIKDMKTVHDATTNSLTLRGKVALQPIDGANPFEINLDLAGRADAAGFIVMKATANQPSLPPEVRVGVKATCLGQDNSCDSSFIDIYVEYRGKIYHHQVESHQEPTLQNPVQKPPVTKPDASKEAPKKEEPKHDKPVTTTPAKPEVGTGKAEVKPVPEKPKDDSNDDDEEDEEDEGADEPQTQGPYVGDIKGDIEKVLNGKPDEKPATPADGGPAKLDQAVGSADKGRLERGTDLLAYQKSKKSPGLHIVNPTRERYYGTTELVYIIAQMADFTQKKLIPNYVMVIGDLSKKAGGKLGSHASHQNGLDADIAFFFKDAKIQDNLYSALSAGKSGAPISSWMADQQWELFKFAVGTKYVDRIFIHQTLKNSLCQLAIKKGEIKQDQKDGVVYETLRRLRPEKNHYNHFHMRVKCSKAQVRCRQMADPPQGTGCNFAQK